MLVIRDPLRYSTITLVVPPLLARSLACFDGRQDEGDLRATLARLAGRLSVGDAAKNLVTALHEAGFLDDERFAELRAARLEEFARAPERPAAHVGSGYPAEAGPLTATLRGYFGAAPPDGNGARGQITGACHRPDGEYVSLAANLDLVTRKRGKVEPGAQNRLFRDDQLAPIGFG